MPVWRSVLVSPEFTSCITLYWLESTHTVITLLIHTNVWLKSGFLWAAPWLSVTHYTLYCIVYASRFPFPEMTDVLVLFSVSNFEFHCVNTTDPCTLLGVSMGILLLKIATHILIFIEADFLTFKHTYEESVARLNFWLKCKKRSAESLLHENINPYGFNYSKWVNIFCKT